MLIGPQGGEWLIGSQGGKVLIGSKGGEWLIGSQGGKVLIGPQGGEWLIGSQYVQHMQALSTAQRSLMDAELLLVLKNCKGI